MKPSTWFGPSGSAEAPRDELVSLADVNEIELLILRRMREFAIGEHASLFNGSGFDFTGLRDWEAGDRFEHIDWQQSSLTNFSPLVVRTFEQPSTSSVVVVADRSTSTRCGSHGTAIATIVARALATIGMSAVFFQDSVGLVTFEDGFRITGGVRPRIGKAQVIALLDAYRGGHGLQEVRQSGSVGGTLGGFMRKTSLVPVVSDFLFENAAEVLRDLVRIGSRHDVVIAVVDAAFAYDVPSVSARWVHAYDVETGRTRVMSRAEACRLGQRVRAWQDDVASRAREAGLDVLRLGEDQTQFDLALAEFVAERRLRRKS